MPDSLADCEAKLRRVDHQFKELKSILDGFTKNHTHPVLREYNVKRRQVKFRVGTFVPVPIEASVVAGEMLHNMRSPLDYLVCRLVERAGAHVTTDHAFPIIEKRSRWARAASHDLASLPAAEIALIEALQPYNGPYGKLHPLAILHRLNNIDKHRLLPLCENSAFGGTYRVYGSHQPVKTKSGKPTFIEEGAHLLTLEFGPGVNVLEVKMEVALSADIAFQDRGPLRNMSLFQTLLAVRAYLHQNVFVTPITAGFNWAFSPLFPIQNWGKHLPPPGGPTRVI